jgi:hypothetical protein
MMNVRNPPPPYFAAPDELEVLLAAQGSHRADYTNLPKHPSAPLSNGTSNEKVKIIIIIVINKILHV